MRNDKRHLTHEYHCAHNHIRCWYKFYQNMLSAPGGIKITLQNRHWCTKISCHNHCIIY